MPSPPDVIALLEGAEVLSRTRDLRDIFRTAAEHAMRFLEGSYGLLFAVRFTPPSLTVSLLGCCVSDGAETFWDDAYGGQPWLPVDPLLASCLEADFGHAISQEGDMWRLAFAVGALGQARWVLEIHGPVRPREAACQALSLFLRCFENQHQQWEYANLDTLTRLLNRKTFDDDFERLIAAAELAEQADKLPLERRTASHPQPCWLGVVDIDFFKKINDNFGHLFGDEVLLRVAELMRQSFRSNDKLFRFGGEEFVIVLRAASEKEVRSALERFRRAIEAYDFPQIGQVTASIGFTMIKADDTIPEIVGRADEALYVAKESGRNQLANYEQLLAEGRVSVREQPGGDIEFF